MRKAINIFSCLFVLVFFSLCKKDTGPSPFKDYPESVGKIFVFKCATSGCHNEASHQAAAGLNLSTWETLFQGSNAGSPVIPFRSDFSSLCYFINTYPELGPVNLPTMPVNGTPLTKEEVQSIKDWINEGAPNAEGTIKWSENSQRKKAYVVNQGCDVVTVLDSETQLPMRYISVGNNPNTTEVPHVVKVSPDGQYWYVIFVNNNIMQKFRCSDDVLVGTANLGANFDWNTMEISDNGKRAYCVAWLSNGHIASVNLETMTLINNLGGFPFPHGVALNGTNDTIYVTAQTGNFIFKLDTGFNNSDQISLQNGFPPSSFSALDAHEIILSPDKKNLYVSCQKTNEIRVYNIPTGMVTQTVSTGLFPQEMALSPAKNKLYVTCTYDTLSFPGAYGTVVEMDLGNYSTQKLKVGFMPHGIAVDESKGVIYVASRNIFSNGPTPHHTSVCGGRNGFVSFIDLNTFTIKGKRIEVSADPYFVSVRN